MLLAARARTLSINGVEMDCISFGRGKRPLVMIQGLNTRGIRGADVIGAAQVQIVTGDASVEIARKLSCKLHMYEDLGHAAYEEAKDFNSLVLSFLQS